MRYAVEIAGAIEPLIIEASSGLQAAVRAMRRAGYTRPGLHRQDALDHPQTMAYVSTVRGPDVHVTPIAADCADCSVTPVL